MRMLYFAALAMICTSCRPCLYESQGMCVQGVNAPDKADVDQTIDTVLAIAPGRNKQVRDWLDGATLTVYRGHQRYDDRPDYGYIKHCSTDTGWCAAETNGAEQKIRMGTFPRCIQLFLTIHELGHVIASLHYHDYAGDPGHTDPRVFKDGCYKPPYNDTPETFQQCKDNSLEGEAIINLNTWCTNEN